MKKSLLKHWQCTTKLVCMVSLSLCLFSAANLQAQITSTWSGGAGNWSDCPPSGNALWDTCPDPPNGLGWPNGNFNAVINGGPVTATSASIVNMTIGSGGSLTFASGTTGLLFLTGTSIVNNGTISIASGNGMSIDGSTSLTLSGSGSVSIAGSKFVGTDGTPTVTLEQPLQGYGNFSLGMNLVNQSTINATGGTLTMQASSVVNTGKFEASSGGTLAFVPGTAVSFNNAGGTIEALNGGTVQLSNSTYTGGTLTSAGTGVIQTSSDAILNNITNTGAIQAGNTTVLQGTVTNNGTITVSSSGGVLAMDGATILSGSGSVLMSGTANLKQFTGSDSLDNKQLIHGIGTIFELPLTNEGTISADATGTLLVTGAVTTNKSFMEATGGGTLQLDGVVNNTGGTIEALSGGNVIFGNSINGGTLTSTGTGAIESQNGTLDGTANIPTNAGTMKVNSFDLFIQGTVNNAGTVTLSGNACVILNQPSTLTGTGKLVMSASSTCIFGAGQPFTNQSTIQGTGSIGDSNPMPITNDGTIMANLSTPLTINAGTYGFTNSGKLTVSSARTLNVVGLFNNLSGTGTLTGGTYNVSGTLGFPGNVVTNAANITLTGSKAEILNTGTSTNALATLSANATTGIISLQSGEALTTATNLSNSGKITVGTGSNLTVGGSYTQTVGATTVDGTLNAPGGMTLTKGSLVGKGTVAAAVTSNTSVTAGDSSTKPGKLSLTGSYTQQSKGVLNIYVGGTTAGTFGELAVSNGVGLTGTLTIKLVNGFIPVVGDSFTIVSGSAVSGTFATVNGTSINSSEHFQVNYSSTAVTLQVVSGP